MEITGKIIKVLPLQTGTSANGEWKKQEYVLLPQESYSSQYPRYVCFGIFVGANKEDKIAAANIKENEEVKVNIDIDSREYQGRWYTNISCWKVEHLAEQPQQAAPQGGAPFPPAEFFDPQKNAAGGESSSDDLPF